MAKQIPQGERDLGKIVATVRQIVVESEDFVVTADVREKLTANRTYYVRTDGSGSNNGLTNTSGGAFSTVAQAIAAAILIDQNGYTVTIQIGDGTYTGAVSISTTPTGPIVINGNSGTPANVILSVTSNHCLQAGVPCQVTIQNLELRTITAGNCLWARGAGARFTIGTGLRFGACAWSHIFSQNGGYINIPNTYSIVGAAQCHYQFSNGGVIETLGSITITNSGTNAFTTFANGTTNGMFFTFNLAFSGGTITGKRHALTLGAVVQTFGGSQAEYFPGNSAGTTTSPAAWT